MEKTHIKLSFEKSSSPRALGVLTRCFYVLLLSVVVLSVSSDSMALPWDQDMYSQQSLKSNEMARSPMEGTVPIGRRAYVMPKEEMEKQENPVRVSQDSVWTGRRLWNANCTVCHGMTGASDGALSKKLAVPNILGDFYKNKTDGKIFSVIHHGQGQMPRYGYKFSIKEHWHIVNYLRFLQGKDVPGIPREKK